MKRDREMKANSEKGRREIEGKWNGTFCFCILLQLCAGN